MPSLKRSAAHVFEQLTGACVVLPHRVGALYEEECVRRIIDAFAIDCVFDVGANAGQFASLLRERLHFAGSIISFEPVPALAKKLRDMASHDSRWFIREVALDATPGAAQFNVARDTQFSSLRPVSQLGHRLFRDQIANAETIEVETTTLGAEIDYWRDRLGFRGAYLKMDTQGADLAVAASAGDQLALFSAIQTEVAIKKLYDDTPDFGECIEFYRARGFELNAIVPNNEGAFPYLYETDCLLVRRAIAERLSAP